MITIDGQRFRLAIVLLVAHSLLAQIASSGSDVEKRVDSLLSQMTLEEKIEIIGGIHHFYTRPIPRLGIPSLRMSDGPMGVHDYGLTTAYPASIALAASWDTDLAGRFGTAMGKDARARGVHIILAPGMNIYRAPMCGRNFEYFGEDPFLASRMAVAVIHGIQGQSVMATAKHYAGNNSEFARTTLSSNIDERTLREIYLPAFEASVKEAKVGAVMDAYNLVNGVHMTQNDHLNNEILKKEWGFDGILMSDWGATHDGVAAALGGLDLEMPSPKFMTRGTLLPLLQQGKIQVALLDDKVRRILRKAIEFGFLDRPQMDIEIPTDSPESREVALEEARGSMVLLKNSGDLLPLDESKLKTIAVIGPDAYPAVPGGGGSSKTKPFHAVSYLEGISARLGTKTRVLHAGDAKTKAITEADAVIICVGFDPKTEREGADRSFALPGWQDKLVRHISLVNKNTIVVLTAGGNVDMTQWVDQVPAIVHAWYPGQEGGTALVQILFGDYSPSGKLPVSFERRWEDNPTFHSYYPKDDETGVQYSEGIFLGYRYFDRSETKPLFPFGYGLSYTTFKYRNLSVIPQAGSLDQPVRVSFDVENTGHREGAEVAELYVGEPHASVPRPVKELKGFAKVDLKPGESKRLTLTLDRRAFSFYDVAKKDWSAEAGEFIILVGGSSSDIQLRKKFTLTR